MKSKHDFIIIATSLVAGFAVGFWYGKIAASKNVTTTK